jgi:hypothetical protein
MAGPLVVFPAGGIFTAFFLALVFRPRPGDPFLAGPRGAGAFASFSGIAAITGSSSPAFFGGCTRAGAFRGAGFFALGTGFRELFTLVAILSPSDM